MRIVFNRVQTLKPKTGIGHYAARLFSALCDELPPGSLHAFPGERLAAVVRRVQCARKSGPTANRRRPAVVRRMSAVARNAIGAAGRGCLGLAFRAACRGGRFDLYHEPNFIPLADCVPAVVTVHDLSVVLHPEWHPADRVRHHENRFRRGLAAACHVLTDTESVRRELIRHLGVAPHRVTTVHLGVGPEFFAAGPAHAAAARRALGLPSDYLLFVGTIEPRKNVATLLRAYCDLPGERRRRCPLVLAGGWGWKTGDVAEFVRTEAADKCVIHLGYTDDRHLPGLYAGARALVFPSHYEGFGLPPLEMLATGGAVLSSTAAALREVVGRHAHFVEPTDGAGWRDALGRAIDDDDWVQMIRTGGRERAASYSWQRCAAETAAVYQALVSPARRAA